jgi:hypothetical protein
MISRIIAPVAVAAKGPEPTDMERFLPGHLWWFTGLTGGLLNQA